MVKLRNSSLICCQHLNYQNNYLNNIFNSNFTKKPIRQLIHLLDCCYIINQNLSKNFKKFQSKKISNDGSLYPLSLSSALVPSSTAGLTSSGTTGFFGGYAGLAYNSDMNFAGKY